MVLECASLKPYVWLSNFFNTSAIAYLTFTCGFDIL